LVPSSHSQDAQVRFGEFLADLHAGELRKAGSNSRLTGQPFQVLALLLERPGRMVTREEFQRRLWPADTFVDFEHGLNAAVNRLREALGDSANSPSFIETLPRRGYRFIASLNGNGQAHAGEAAQSSGAQEVHSSPAQTTSSNGLILRYSILTAALVLVVATAAFLTYRKGSPPGASRPRALTRLTFDEGLQFGPTWSPDARFIAYSSDRGGKLDIWVQQVSGGDPIQVTKGPGDNSTPSWSPDGKYIAFRSERGDGGLFIMPALGGADWVRKVASFGYYPRWSPDGLQILFQSAEYAALPQNRFYVADASGGEPREIPMEFLTGQYQVGLSAAWHPDGKRISVWACAQSSLNLWTQPIGGGPAIKSEMNPAALEQMEEASQGRGIAEWASDFAFSWAPSGKAIYLERTFRGAKNIWRLTMDSQNLRGLAFDRLTTGPGDDTGLSLSTDGKKLAFTGERQQVRAWMFPFDASRGQIKGAGKAVTAPGVEAWEFSLSQDGKDLAYRGNRAGKWELRGTSLEDGREIPIAADETYLRNFPQWSRDGKHVAYFREKVSTRERQLVDWSTLSRDERPVTLAEVTGIIPYDWSPDGKWLLTSNHKLRGGNAEIWALSTTAGAQAGSAGRRLVFDPAYNLYQSHFSPDGRWIVFVAVRPMGLQSAIYVVSADGGPWIPVTDGMHWDDKPRWSPDGKIIYFVSARSGFYNVFGVPFDPSKKTQGQPFQVTQFSSPGLMIPKQIMSVELALTRDRLVVTLGQTSGSIWMLDLAGQDARK
jgi:Tol biopolymer transport system component/DNA-binding winged helix-turn-helix (wHTH) protein